MGRLFEANPPLNQRRLQRSVEEAARAGARVNLRTNRPAPARSIGNLGQLARVALCSDRDQRQHWAGAVGSYE